MSYRVDLEKVTTEQFSSVTTDKKNQSHQKARKYSAGFICLNNFMPTTHQLLAIFEKLDLIFLQLGRTCFEKRF